MLKIVSDGVAVWINRNLDLQKKKQFIIQRSLENNKDIKRNNRTDKQIDI